MTEMEKLVIAQALFKVLSSAVSTKDPDNIRGRMDAQAIENYASTGAKSFDLTINGLKVGTYTIRMSRAIHRIDLIVQDQEAYLDWCVENGYAKETVTYELVAPVEGLGKLELDALDLLKSTGVIREKKVVEVSNFALNDAKKHFEATGEVPEGCIAETIDEPSKPMGTLLKVDTELVARALGKELPSVVAGLLTEGELS